MSRAALEKDAAACNLSQWRLAKISQIHLLGSESMAVTESRVESIFIGALRKIRDELDGRVEGT